jgi:hypothetical protein
MCKSVISDCSHERISVCKLCRGNTAWEVIVNDCSYVWLRIVIKELPIRTASSVD